MKLGAFAMVGLALALGSAAALAQGRPSGPVIAHLAHWPDVIVCHVPEASALDIPSGLGTGKMIPAHTLVSRLALAPGSDGRYYYAQGPVGFFPGHAGRLPEGATLGFNPDGSSAGRAPGDCDGRSISELQGSGAAQR